MPRYFQLAETTAHNGGRVGSLPTLGTMKESDYVFHLADNLKYSKIKLLEEMQDIKFEPFHLLGPNKKGDSNLKKDGWFYNNKTWLIGHVLNEYPEILNLKKQISDLFGCKDIKPRFYRQEKNSSIPAHKDQGTLCAVNIILSDNYTPIEFENFGKIFYECALINVNKKHWVNKFPEERILLKYSIFDITYQEARRNAI